MQWPHTRYTQSGARDADKTGVSSHMVNGQRGEKRKQRDSHLPEKRLRKTQRETYAQVAPERHRDSSGAIFRSQNWTGSS